MVRPQQGLTHRQQDTTTYDVGGKRTMEDASQEAGELLIPHHHFSGWSGKECIGRVPALGFIFVHLYRVHV